MAVAEMPGGGGSVETQPEPYRAVLSGSREGSGRGARRRGGDSRWSLRGLATASSLLLLASVCGVLFFRSGGTMQQGLASNSVELQSNLPADVQSCIRACVHVNMMVSASSPSGSPHASCSSCTSLAPSTFSSKSDAKDTTGTRMIDDMWRSVHRSELCKAVADDDELHRKCNGGEQWRSMKGAPLEAGEYAKSDEAGSSIMRKWADGGSPLRECIASAMDLVQAKKCVEDGPEALASKKESRAPLEFPKGGPTGECKGLAGDEKLLRDCMAVEEGMKKALEPVEARAFVRHASGGILGRERKMAFGGGGEADERRSPLGHVGYYDAQAAARSETEAEKRENAEREAIRKREAEEDEEEEREEKERIEREERRKQIDKEEKEERKKFANSPPPLSGPSSHDQHASSGRPGADYPNTVSTAKGGSSSSSPASSPASSPSPSSPPSGPSGVGIVRPGRSSSPQGSDGDYSGGGGERRGPSSSSRPERGAQSRPERDERGGSDQGSGGKTESAIRRLADSVGALERAVARSSEETVDAVRKAVVGVATGGGGRGAGNPGHSSGNVNVSPVITVSPVIQINVTSGSSHERGGDHRDRHYHTHEETHYHRHEGGGDGDDDDDGAGESADERRQRDEWEKEMAKNMAKMAKRGGAGESAEEKREREVWEKEMAKDMAKMAKIGGSHPRENEEERWEREMAKAMAKMGGEVANGRGRGDGSNKALVGLLNRTISDLEAKEDAAAAAAAASAPEPAPEPVVVHVDDVGNEASEHAENDALLKMLNETIGLLKKDGTEAGKVVVVPAPAPAPAPATGEERTPAPAPAPAPAASPAGAGPVVVHVTEGPNDALLKMLNRTIDMLGEKIRAGSNGVAAPAKPVIVRVHDDGGASERLLKMLNKTIEMLGRNSRGGGGRGGGHDHGAVPGIVADLSKRLGRLEGRMNAQPKPGVPGSEGGQGEGAGFDRGVQERGVASVDLAPSKPVILPTGGDFKDPVIVRFLHSGLPAGSRIFYTTDGSKPGQGSTLYGGAFVLPPGKATVSAVSIVGKGQGAKESNVTTATFEVAECEHSEDCCHWQLTLSRLEALQSSLGRKNVSEAERDRARLAGAEKRKVDFLDAESDYRVEQQKIKGERISEKYALNFVEIWGKATKVSERRYQAIVAENDAERSQLSEEQKLIRQILRMLEMMKSGKGVEKDDVKHEMLVIRRKIQALRPGLVDKGALEGVTSSLAVMQEANQVTALLEKMLEDLEERSKVLTQIEVKAGQVVEQNKAKLKHWQVEAWKYRQEVDDSNKREAESNEESKMLGGTVTADGELNDSMHEASTSKGKAFSSELAAVDKIVEQTREKLQQCLTLSP